MKGIVTQCSSEAGARGVCCGGSAAGALGVAKPESGRGVGRRARDHGGGGTIFGRYHHRVGREGPENLN